MSLIKKSIGFILKKVHKLDRYFIDNKNDSIIQKVEPKNRNNISSDLSKNREEYNKLVNEEFKEKNKINQNKDTINYQNSIDNFSDNYVNNGSNNYTNNRSNDVTNNRSNNFTNNTKTNSENSTVNNSTVNKQNSLEEKPLKNTYTKEELNKLENTKIYDVNKIDFNKINTIWDVIKIKENTQAEHIIKSLSADQWMDIEDIKRRIKLEFNIEYQNEKSLYPYIKTLTDINLIKVNNTGKKRTWKKNIILIENK